MKQVLALDFGSQYTQLIVRKLREGGVYSEILPGNAPVAQIAAKNPSGIIFSGSPSSIYIKNPPKPDPAIYKLNLPILGICYGMHLLCDEGGGKVLSAKKREYGFAEISVSKNVLFDGLPKNFQVWMSHGDEVKKLGAGFSSIGKTSFAPYAAVCDERKKRYAVQFHPEVAHTNFGAKMLENFARKICGYKERWTPGSFLNQAINEIKVKTAGANVICGLSGGVDSSVAAAIIHKAIGKRLYCVFVDNGLLREGDREKMKNFFGNRLNVKIVDASKLFISRLKNITDPEQKRKIIGKTFIEVFEVQARKIKNVKFLAQGTLYPDVIESISVMGPSVTIKSHHNVGGLPQKMKLGLIEPLRFFFKDEVRALGRTLKMPPEILDAHPFPGPGLAVRILGEVTPERLKLLRMADKIVREEIKVGGWQKKAWQSFAVLLSVKSVGVMGDERTYENAIAVRSVDSVDGMTADWSKLPHDILQKISGRIVSEIRGINRVVYDITSKPPGTIEWE